MISINQVCLNLNALSLAQRDGVKLSFSKGEIATGTDSSAARTAGRLLYCVGATEWSHEITQLPPIIDKIQAFFSSDEWKYANLEARAAMASRLLDARRGVVALKTRYYSQKAEDSKILSKVCNSLDRCYVTQQILLNIPLLLHEPVQQIRLNLAALSTAQHDWVTLWFSEDQIAPGTSSMVAQTGTTLLHSIHATSWNNNIDRVLPIIRKIQEFLENNETWKGCATVEDRMVMAGHLQAASLGVEALKRRPASREPSYENTLLQAQEMLTACCSSLQQEQIPQS